MAKTRSDNNSDAFEQVAAYHRELQVCLREHESKFDNAVLLVAGGAFTISAAYLSDLPTPLNASMWLAISWVSWGGCLLVGVGGHLVGAHATKRVLDLLDSQVYDFKALMSGKAVKLIKPLNIMTFVLLIVGFIAFGWFTFANLEFGGQREEEQQGLKEEGRQKEGGRRTDQGTQPAVAGAALATTQTHVSQVRHDDDRKKAAATTPASATAATDSQVGPSAAHARKADGPHGAKPAAGLAPAKEVDPQKADGN